MTTDPIQPHAIRWLACLALALLVAGCSGQEAHGRRPVVLVTVDTLRADRVGLYGTGPSLTPHMDRLGREGTVAEDAVAPVPRTTQSIGSVLTGLHPLRHGAEALHMTLPGHVTTLAERFEDAGYATGAFVSNVVLRPGQGFEQGFDTYENPRNRWVGDSGAELSRAALAWLDDLAAGRSFFLWLHYLDPHWPYDPPEGTPDVDPAERALDRELRDRRQRGEISKGELVFALDRILAAEEIEVFRRLYEAEVRATDRAIGDLVEGLAERALLDDALILLTADHGESLGAHAYWFAHGEYLYDDTLRVPLLIRAPGLVPAGLRISGLVRLEDVAPTLLDLAGLPPVEAPDGVSLRPQLAGAELPQRRALQLTDHQLVREENPRRPVRGPAGRWWALREGRWKLIRVPRRDGSFHEELYDLASDPQEAHNLAAIDPTRAGALRDLLLAEQARLSSGSPPPELELTPEDREVLRELGYLN